MKELPDWFEVDRWVPPPGSIENRRVWKLMQKLGFKDYYEFLRFSTEHPEDFYKYAMEDLNLEWPVPWDQFQDSSNGTEWTNWFVNGRTNLTWLALERWRDSEIADKPALHWEGEDGRKREYTHRQLAEEVDQLTAGLRSIGVKDGDVIGMYLPSIPETVTALFAVARMGAVLAPAFSGYGADALAERLKLVGAKYLITTDGYLRRGKIVDMKSVVDAAVDASDVTCTIVISRDDVTPSRRKGDVEWSHLLEQGVDRDYEMFAAEKPWLIAFTSGSTGRPKAAVHTHGGLPYQGSIERAYCLDLSKDSVLYYPSDMGWITTPYSIVTSFILGGRHLLYEGAPTYPQPDTIWSLVDRYGVTTLGCGPTLMRQLAAEGEAWVEPHGLETLDVIISAGEPMTAAAWRWMHKFVGRGRIAIMNHTGGTEIGCGLLSGSPIVPMKECRFAGPPAGISAIVVDENGERIFNTLGDIAVPSPWPSMSRGFWNDPERWSETYKSKWPGLYLHGDRAIEFDDGSWEMPGRSDDLLKIGGKRIGPGEFESLAIEVPGVLNAAAVGVPDPIKGESVVMLIILDPDSNLSGGEVEENVKSRIESALGKPFRPSRVAAIDEIPLTRSGKVHRRALRSWIKGVPPGDLSNLLNPDSEASIRRLFGSK